MKNPLHRPGIKSGVHRLGGVGVERKVRIRDIVSPQALVDEKKVAKLARFTKNMPGKATVSWNGQNWLTKDGNHRINAALKQGKRKMTVLVQKLSSKYPIQQISKQLDRAIEFALPRDERGNITHKPGISRDVLHNTPFTQSEIGRGLYNAAVSRGTPTDASGESRIVTQPGGRKLIRTTIATPGRPEGSHATSSVLSPNIKASDLRNEPKFKGAVRRAIESEHAPKLAEAAAKQNTQAGKDRIYKEAKAAVGEEIKPQNLTRKLRDTRTAIAQTARVRHEIGTQVSRKIPGLNRNEHQGVVESAHENLKGHLGQALESRKTQGGALHADILKQTHEALVKADKRFSPTMHKRDLEKLRIAHEANAHELMKATFGGGSENPHIDVNSHSKLIGKNLHPVRRQYRNLIETPYGNARTTTAKGKTHLGGSSFKHLQRQIIKSGKIFEGVPEAAAKIPEVKTNLKKFPLAKGIGAAAGLLGAGLLARKLLKKPEEQKQLMSSRIRPILFARKPMPKISKYAAKLIRRKEGVTQKVKLSPLGQKLAYQRSDRIVQKTMKKAEDAAAGKSQWTHPEHGPAQSVDYAKHAIGNEDEIRKAANLKARKELPADAPHSLHPMAQTYRDEADAVTQSKNYWQKEATEARDFITKSKDPIFRRNEKAAVARVGKDAAKEVASARSERDAAIQGAKDNLKKGIGRVMGARRAALGRQAEAHAGEMEGARTRMIRNTAIGAGAGVIAGASLTGNDSHKKKEFSAIQFSGDTLTAIQHGLMSAGTTKTGSGALKRLNALLRRIERKAPIVAEPVKGYIQGGRAVLPGSATAGAVGGTIKGVREQFRKRLTPEQVLGKIQMRPTARLSAKGDILQFDVSPLQNLRNKLRPEEKPSTLHDVATGSLEGSVGSLAFIPVEHKVMHPKLPWKNPLLDIEGKFSKTALAKRLAVGGAIGGLATGVIGAGVSAASKAKKDREKVFASKAKTLHFDIAQGPITRTAVTKDRYIKKIHEDDINRAESGYLRTGLGGAAAGSLLAKRLGTTKSKAALIGGLAGLGTQAVVRQSTKGTRDQFGDRSFNGKRVDRLPSQLTGVAALGLAGKAAHDKLQAAKIAASGMARKAKIAGLAGLGLWGASKLFSAKGSNDLIEFARDQETPEYLAWKQGMEASKNEATDWRKSKSLVNQTTQGVKRGHRLLKDIVSAAKGQKNLDSRGRERKREWDKPWVRAAVTGGIGVTTAAVFHKAMRGTGKGSPIADLKDLHKQGRVGDYLSDKIPGFKHVRGLANRIKGQGADEVASASKGPIARFVKAVKAHTPEPPVSTADLSGAEKRTAEAASKRLKGILRSDPKSILDYSSKIPVVRFAAEDWETRREGDLFQVAKIRRRDRRAKKILEEKKWQDAAVTPAKMGLSFIGGGLAAQLYNRQNKAEVPKASPTPGGGTPVVSSSASLNVAKREPGNVIRGVFGKTAKKIIHHHSLNPLIQLSADLDAALN